jgi:hypothetical protein
MLAAQKSDQAVRAAVLSICAFIGAGVFGIAVAPFDEVGAHGVCVPDRVLLADDTNERIDRLLARALMFRLSRHH